MFLSSVKSILSQHYIINTTISFVLYETWAAFCLSLYRFTLWISSILQFKIWIL